MNKYVASLLLLPSVLLAQDRNVALPDGWAADPPVLDSLITFARGESELRVAVIRYVADKAAIERRYQVRYSPRRLDRLRQHYAGWDRQLGAVDFDALNPEGQIDYIALRNRIAYDQEMLRLDAERGEQIAPLIPFGDSLRLLQEERHDRERVEPRSAAETLNTVAKQIALISPGP